jgi:hypothetical protein
MRKGFKGAHWCHRSRCKNCLKSTYNVQLINSNFSVISTNVGGVFCCIWLICIFYSFLFYCNERFTWTVATLALGSRPKQRGCKRCGPRGSLGATWHTPGSVGKYEGVNPHTPKATPTLGDGILVDSQNFIEQFEGSKLNSLWRSLYHWKALETWMSKMGSHCSFGHLKHKKGRESNCQFDSRPKKVGNRPVLLGYRQRATYSLKALDESYNFALDRTSIRGLLTKLWGSKVAGVPVGAISRLPCGSPGTEKPFRCGPRGEVQSIL